MRQFVVTAAAVWVQFSGLSVVSSGMIRVLLGGEAIHEGRRVLRRRGVVSGRYLCGFI